MTRTTPLRTTDKCVVVGLNAPNVRLSLPEPGHSVDKRLRGRLRRPGLLHYRCWRCAGHAGAAFGQRGRLGARIEGVSPSRRLFEGGVLLRTLGILTTPSVLTACRCAQQTSE